MRAGPAQLGQHADEPRISQHFQFSTTQWGDEPYQSDCPAGLPSRRDTLARTERKPQDGPVKSSLYPGSDPAPIVESMKPKISLAPVAPPARNLSLAGPTLEPVVSAELARPALDDLRDAAPKIAISAPFALKLRRA